MMKWSCAQGRKSQKMFEKGFIAHLESDKGCCEIKVTCCSVCLSPDDLWTAEGLQDCGADDQHVCNGSDRWDDTSESMSLSKVKFDELVDKKTLTSVADWRNKMILMFLFPFLCFYLFKNKVCVCQYAFEKKREQEMII